MNININKLVQATKKINDKEIQKELDELQKAIDSVKQERLDHVNHIIKKHDYKLLKQLVLIEE